MKRQPDSLAASPLSSIGSWVGSTSLVIFTVTVVVVSVFRNGLHVSGWLDTSASYVSEFPVETDWNSSSILPIAISRLLPDEIERYVLTFLPGYVVLGVLAVSVWRRFSSQSRLASRIAIVGLLMSPVASILMGNGEVGTDWLTIAGIFVFVLAQRRSTAALGVAVAALSHPEQALVAMTLLLIVSRTYGRVVAPRRAAIALASTAVVFISIQVWLTLASTSSSRLALLASRLTDMVLNFAVDFNGAIYAAFAAGWVLLVFWFWSASQQRRGNPWPIAVAVGLTLGFTAATFDGTRVSAAVSTGLLATAILAVAQLVADTEARSGEHATSIAGSVFLFFVLMPAIVWRWSEFYFGSTSWEKLLEVISHGN